MKNKKERFVYVLWIVVTVLIFGLIGILGQFSAFENFFKRAEWATFDIRQNIISKYKSHNESIVIVEVDDSSYEYIMDKFSWPLSRGAWAEIAGNIEKANPNYIVFDLLFLKPMLNDPKGDKALIELAGQYDNIYFAMNFDNYSDEIRKSPELEDKFKIKVKNITPNDYSFYSYANARMVMDGIRNATKNVGSINIIRSEDGIIRNEIPIYGYKESFYPNISLLVALDILNKDKIEIKNNFIIIDRDHKIPINKTGEATLNWYGKSKTFKRISLWKVMKAIKENDHKFLEDNFKYRTIYVGTTATSLSDVKSVPVDYDFAGVEIHATFLNNILDNDFIKKVPFKVDLVISLILCMIIGFTVLKSSSILKSSVFLILTLGLYLIFATVVMNNYNIWLGVIIPLISMVLAFVGVYLIKYLLISKNYEHTYKLAVTDGLTQLYNHRYFQEQMILLTNNYHRYGNKFSLILIDIDFFKKFNDTYGHQSGDCVLIQVANILKKNSRISDIACRYGGEEMAIILVNTPKEEAIITANKICNAVRENKFTLMNNETVNVTISVGVATIGDDATKAQDLIEYSDKCLYKAKESGRNQVQSTID